MSSIRLWRARVYGAYVALAFAVVALTVGPLVILCPGQANRRRLGGLGMRLVLRLAGIPFHVHGREHLPHRPCVAVANHVSYLDGLVLTAALPPDFSFVIKAEAGQVPLLGLFLRRMGATFVTRGDPRRASVETYHLIRCIHAGVSLAVFPEGTFSASPELLPFRLGAFTIAARAGVPVVPVAISGTRDVLSNSTWLPRRGRIRIELLPALPPMRRSRGTAAYLRDAAFEAVRTGIGDS